MDLRFAAPTALAAALALASCGGSSDGVSTAGSTSPSPSATATVAASVRAALTQRLSLAPKFPHETDGDRPAVATAEAFAAEDTDLVDAERLRTNGLDAVGTEHPLVDGTDGALLLVGLFDTARQAAADIEKNMTQAAPQATVKLYSVPGVPRAKVNEILAPDGRVGGRNAFFSVGRYQYVIGVAPSAAATDAPTRQQLAAMAAAWYAKVKGLG